MSAQRDLFGNERERRHHDGPKAIVHVPAERCPDCGGPSHTQTRDQESMLRHGGYGATERTVIRSCPCGWSMVAETSEVKP